jgi:hypothetical protein
MRNKNCPWCQHKLSLKELLFLDEQAPTACLKCGKNFKNSSINSIISGVLPVTLCFTALYLFDIGLLYSLSLLILIPVLRITLAEPLKYNPNSFSQTCFQCQRSNVGFKNSFSNICNDCLLFGKNQTDSQTTLRQK